MFLSTKTGQTIKVAIIRSSSIGDVILATACLNLLEKIDHPVEVIWIGRSPTIGLISEAFPQVQTVDLDKYMQVTDLIEQLLDCHFLCDLQTNLRSARISRAFTKLTGKPHFSAKKERWQRGALVAKARVRGRFQRQSVGDLKPKRRQFEMMLDCLLRGLRTFLPVERFDSIRAAEAKPHLPDAHDGKRRVWLQEIQGSRWLAIGCGASFEPKKTPLEVFAQIIEKAQEDAQRIYGSFPPPFGLLLLGDHNDRQDALKLLEILGWNDPVLNFAGQLSLWETSLALRHASALITNDSSLGHIAEAVGVDAAVLFGPTVEAFGFAPWRSHSLALSSNIGCRPCSKHGKTTCRYGDKLCFYQIAVDKAVEFVLNHMQIKSHSSEEEL